MTHSFLLAFCHLHIILHFFSRSPPLPAPIVSPFLPQSFNPSFILSLSFSLFFHNFLLFPSLASPTPIFLRILSRFHLFFLQHQTTGRISSQKHFGNICFLLGGERRKKCNFNPRLFQFQFSFHAFCTCTLQFVLIIPAFDI